MMRLRDAHLPPASAVIFDKDGVLVDFQARWLAITEARLGALSLRMPLQVSECESLKALWGVRGDRIDPTGPLVTGGRIEVIALAAGHLYKRGTPYLDGRALIEAAFDEAENQEKLQRFIKPTGELRPALEALRARGIKLAVATTDLTARAEHDLFFLGISAYFDVVLGVDTVAHNKPHPDLFLAACHRLGVAPQEAWMVGDALNDMRMARAAHAGGAIGVRSGISSGELLAPEADLVLSGIWELPSRLED